MPPIKVALIEDARVVVDGWHRLAALEKIGRYEVEGEIVKATAREALWLAAQANLEHGLPLKSPEIRAAFRAYIRAQQHRGPRGNLKSYRQIAQELGGVRRYTTIRNWMKKDFRKIFDAMGGADPLGATRRSHSGLRHDREEGTRRGPCGVQRRDLSDGEMGAGRARQAGSQSDRGRRPLGRA
jgi:hypothetical protein